jgi:beta-lactamase regulating signal transducer with metallopeptidase domain
MTGLAFALPSVESFAQIAVERVLNSLPEGLLIALCAWILLRLMGRHNAGTRFAVWLVALAGVAALPLLSGMELSRHALSAGHAEVTVSGFWAVLFVALWIPIAAIAFARVIAGVWQVRDLRRKCTEVELSALDPILQEVMQPVNGAGKHRSVRLLTSDDARVPAAIGFFHPAIVLPAWCLREMTADELKPILIHERSHLQRGDDWTNLLQKAVRAVLFFHPAVWWIDARLAVEREMACDDAVLAETGNPRAYAGTLIGLLERSCARRGWTMAQAAVARARDASVRIARILEGKSAATTRVGRGALGLAAALCVTCCGVLAFTPQLVEFAPDAAGTAARAAVQRHAIDAAPASEALHGAAVVPAMFHPQQQRRPLVIRKAAQSMVASDSQAAPEHTASQKAPAVVMAKLDESSRQHAGKQPQNAAPAMQMLMVVETAETDYAVATPASGAQLGAVPVSETGVMQVRTLQVLEQDETGAWHLRIYRVVTFVPAAEAGSMQSSI